MTVNEYADASYSKDIFTFRMQLNTANGGGRDIRKDLNE